MNDAGSRALPSLLISSQGVDWLKSDLPVPYPAAIAFMEARIAAIHAGQAAECCWLLEHPPLYTAGTSAKMTDLLDANRFPVFPTGRGGQLTYHGPGQRIVYVMLDLKRRRRDVRLFVHGLEGWLIRALAQFAIQGERRQGRVGIWVQKPDGSEAKIAAIGVRLRRWITFHGISLNRRPELDHFSAIVPCGVSEHGVTSLGDLGKEISAHELDRVLIESFEASFGKSTPLGLTAPAHLRAPVIDTKAKVEAPMRDLTSPDV